MDIPFKHTVRGLLIATNRTQAVDWNAQEYLRIRPVYYGGISLHQPMALKLSGL